MKNENINQPEEKSTRIQKFDNKLSPSMKINYRTPHDLNEFANENLLSIINWMSQFIKLGRTLVYFASGTHIYNEYKSLAYENVILVDYSFKQCCYDGDKIFTLSLDALMAVYVLKRLNVKIDCLVCINEGLYEGGGKYSLNSDSFLGYCFPLFADRLIHLGIKDYYCGNEYFHQRTHYLDLPYNEKNVITPIDNDYISPLIFSPQQGHRAEVTVLENKSDKVHRFNRDGILLSIIHGSIWDDAEKLDLLFVGYENDYQKSVFQKIENKTIDLKSFEKKNGRFTLEAKKSINELCLDNQIERIGFIPNGVCYLDLAVFLANTGQNNLKEICFFHLNKDDYKSLYKEKFLKREWNLKSAHCIYRENFDND